MAQQNIYDNEIFFEGYKKIRDNEVNANNLFEIPASIEKMIEPFPTTELLEKYPDYKDLFHKPDFLLVKVRK